MDETTAAMSGTSESSFDVRQQQQQQHQSNKTGSNFDKSNTSTSDFFLSTGELPKQQLEREVSVGFIIFDFSLFLRYFHF